MKRHCAGYVRAGLSDEFYACWRQRNTWDREPPHVARNSRRLAEALWHVEATLWGIPLGDLNHAPLVIDGEEVPGWSIGPPM